MACHGERMGRLGRKAHLVASIRRHKVQNDVNVHTFMFVCIDLILTIKSYALSPTHN